MRNLGFLCMSPKVNSKGLCESFKMSQCQQKFVVKEALRNKCQPVFQRVKWACCYNAFNICRTNNFEWYRNLNGQKSEEIRKKNKRRRIIFYYDNANSRASAPTTKYLNGQNIELMGNPPYKLDLVTNDLFLLPYVKNKQRCPRFSTIEEAVDELKTNVLGIP